MLCRLHLERLMQRVIEFGDAKFHELTVTHITHSAHIYFNKVRITTMLALFAMPRGSS